MSTATEEHRLTSRKFITTMTGMLLGSITLFAGVLMKAPEGFWSALPAYFLLIGGGIGAYNWANLRQSQNGGAPK